MSAVALGNIYAEPLVLIGTEVANISTADTASQVVPAGESWELIGAIADVTTSSSAGNRTIQVQVADADGNIYYATAVNSNVAADAANTIQSFRLNGPTVAANDVVELTQGIHVAPGMNVSAVDAADIDAASDVIELRLLVKKTYIPVQ